LRIIARAQGLSVFCQDCRHVPAAVHNSPVRMTAFIGYLSPSPALNSQQGMSLPGGCYF
jgi:hypothetical protein